MKVQIGVISLSVSNNTANISNAHIMNGNSYVFIGANVHVDMTNVGVHSRIKNVGTVVNGEVS